MGMELSLVIVMPHLNLFAIAIDLIDDACKFLNRYHNEFHCNSYYDIITY